MGGLVSSLTGTGGGAGGTGFATPQQANIADAATTAQATDLYGTNQAALQQQQSFVNALQGQNGIQNQSNVFNQLQGVANGTGPNPAQAMLNQSTGQNVQQQAALMASQRGAGQNAGMIARQASQQGANIQQQAAGQAASQQAQQSLGAMGQLGNMAGQMVGNQASAIAGNTQAQQGEQANILNSISQANSARAGVQSSINSANASMANTRMGQQGQMVGNIMGGAGSVMSMFAGGGEVTPPAPVAIDPGTDQGAPPPSQGQGGGSGGGAGGLLKLAALLSNGGPVPSMDTMGSAPYQPYASPSPSSQTQAKGPKSNAAKFFSGYANNASKSGPNQDPLSSGSSTLGKIIGNGIKSLFASNTDTSASPSGFTPEQMSTSSVQQPAINSGALPGIDPLQQTYGYANPETQLPASNDTPAFAKGGKVPVLLSPGEKKLTPKQAEKVAKGGSVEGQTVPGKPRVGGAKNSYANDTVKSEEEPGTLILPRSVTQSKNPHWAAHKFVLDHMAQQGKILPKRPKK